MFNNSTSGYSLSDIAAVTGGRNNGFGGDDGYWWIILLFLCFGNGWGNGGFGFGGNRGGYGGIAENYTLATDFATIERKLDGVNTGLCDGFYAQNTNMLNGFAGVQQTLCQGFSGVNATVNSGFANVNNAICTLGYQNQAGFNALGTQLASCCCDIRQAISDCCCTTQRSIDRVSYENAKNTCDIIRAGQDNTRAILDYLTTEKISSLQAENSGLKAQISNDRQTRTIVNELRDGCPIPAYLTCNPNAPFGYGYGVPFTNCGCTNIQ